MIDEKERERILREARANVEWGRSIARDLAERLQRVEIPDPMTRYRAEAAERAAATEAETRKRLAATRREQHEREIRSAIIVAEVDDRIASAIAVEREFLREVVGEAVGQLLKENMQPVERMPRTISKRAT